MVLFLKKNKNRDLRMDFFSKNSDSANESLKIKMANRLNHFSIHRVSCVLFNNSGHMMGPLPRLRLEISSAHNPHYRETHMPLNIQMLRTFSNIKSSYL